MLGNQERKFKKFILHMNVSMNLFFLLSFGALCSLTVFSLELFLLFIFISFVELAFAWCWWKNGMDRVRFKEIMTILAILNIGFYAVMPLILFAYGSIIFLVVCAIYLAVLGFTILKRSVIADGIINPKDSKIGKGFMIGSVVIMLVGGFASGMNGQEGLVLQQLTDLGHKIYAFSVLFLIGLLMTFVSPVILKHKEAKIEAEKPLRRKTTRAQRRREAEKKKNAVRN